MLLEVVWVGGGQVHVEVVLAHVEAVVLAHDHAPGDHPVLDHAADQEEEVDQVRGQADHAEVLQHVIQDVAEVQGAEIAQNGQIELQEIKKSKK